MGTLRLPALLALLALACAPRLPYPSGRARPPETRGAAARPAASAPSAAAAPPPTRAPLRALDAERAGPGPAATEARPPVERTQAAGAPLSGGLAPAESGASPAAAEQAVEDAAFKTAGASTETAKPGRRRAAPVAVAISSGAAPAAGAAPAGAPAAAGGPVAGGASPAAAATAHGGAGPAASAAPAGGPPPMSSMDRAEIEEMLSQRLDVGAYRLQISATRDFKVVLFDRTYDAMRDINLFEEFRGTGVPLDRDAYWVRIAFIDLLQVEEDFTAPRLYSLDKRRVESGE